MVKSVLFSQYKRLPISSSTSLPSQSREVLPSSSTLSSTALFSGTKKAAAFDFSISALLNLPRNLPSHHHNKDHEDTAHAVLEKPSKILKAPQRSTIAHLIPLKKRILLLEHQAGNTPSSKKFGHASSSSSTYLIPHRLERTVHDEGSSTSSNASIRRKKFCQPIAKVIEEWIGFTQAERDLITFAAFAKSHNRTIRTLDKYVTKEGHTRSCGQRILEQIQGRKYKTITPEHIYAWCNLQQNERDLLTVQSFADQHELNPNSLRDCVTRQGKIRIRGHHVLNKAKKISYRKITSQDIQKWCNLSQTERDAITFHGFVEQNQFNLRTWENYVTAKGKIRVRGQRLINKLTKLQQTKITADHLLTWKNMSPKQRIQCTFQGFATARQLNPKTFKNYITSKGVLRIRGQRIIDKAYPEHASEKISSTTTSTSCSKNNS